MAGSTSRTSVSLTMSSQAIAVEGVPPSTIVRFHCSWASGSSASVGAHSLSIQPLLPKVSPTCRVKVSAASRLGAQS